MAAWCVQAVLLLPATTYAGDPPHTECAIRLTDVTAETDVNFVHFLGGCGKQYIVEFMAAGLALFDYDGDGLEDVYFLNGAPLRGTTVDTRPGDSLYRNNGDWTFTDVTEAAGVGDTGYGLGIAVGDYDHDGHPDIYLNNFGPNVLYRNNGDGTFSDVTQFAGVANGDKFGAGACFFDMDRDGDLDLYVANYLEFTYERQAIAAANAYPYPPGPQDFPPVADSLFRNNGDGTFTDVSQSSGIGLVAGTSMGMICFDYEDDGDTDIFVANDAMVNFLFRNDGTGKFDEVALAAGVACNYQGVINGSMGVDCGDYDCDGLLDLFLTDYSGQLPVLYRNLGRGLFADVTSATGAGRTTQYQTKWGTGLIDFDNDGDCDIFIACGHFLENIRAIDDRASYRTANVLLMNTGDGKFLDVSRRCGAGLAVVESSRGAVFGDLDNDGDVDAVVLNSGTRATILRNESETDNHWLQILLRGVDGNRDGVGARVKVVAGDRSQVAEVHSGRGYQSHFGTRLHFGLGPRDRVDSIEVRWIGGRTETFTARAVDRLLILSEGTGGGIVGTQVGELDRTQSAVSGELE